MIKGNMLNVFTEEIYPAELKVKNGIITCVKPVKKSFDNIIIPGLIDAHIHIESSMLTPSRFAETVVPHGTTAVVSDPHEIANTMGLDGIQYMMDDAANVPLKTYFTAPSCVPATSFETSGAIIGPEEVEKLLKMDGIVALGEMMNFPGVLNEDPHVLGKIDAAKRFKKPVDGHAPLLSGSELCKYVSSGISTEHECTEIGEALEKKRLGMKLMLREGSSAKNLKDLFTAGGEFIVSDDKHPEDLQMGHVDVMIRNAVEYGVDPVEAVKMVTLNPSNHYGLNSGSISHGKPADLVFVDDLENFKVERVFINGELVAEEGKPLFKVKPLDIKGTFNFKPKTAQDFQVKSIQNNVKETVRVIEVLEGQLLTLESEAILNAPKGSIEADVTNDILKIAVVERYGHNRISNAFVKGFDLKKGAIASSVAHDSHNIVVVGTTSHDMAEAVNKLLKINGGIVATADGEFSVLNLPIAGLMSKSPVDEVADKLNELHGFVRNMGSKLKSPFMTMSFMALLVIPKLKISDQGLFNVETFEFVDVVKKD
ncbi:adenine deaminase [Methanobacterium aggregans]|uniref:adenine deaminase n=1 Tax=Methanobacterium aggregans TaxID=1615586 RepID=UPI001AE542A1|nr:adenine deaminase [Methanobacterium aggregans]MBP2045673.1 adenine deaminase [Methanobacterium aggregans]